MTKLVLSVNGYVVADSSGLVQMHTLSSNRRDSWFSLWGRPLTNQEIIGLKKQGFRTVPVNLRDREAPAENHRATILRLQAKIEELSLKLKNQNASRG